MTAGGRVFYAANSLKGFFGFSAGYKTRHPTNVDADNISEPRSYVGTLVAGFEPAPEKQGGSGATVVHLKD